MCHDCVCLCATTRFRCLNLSRSKTCVHYKHCNIRSYFMRACSLQPIQDELWTMTNGYLPPALEINERRPHLSKNGFVFSEFGGFGPESLATARNSYSSKLEENSTLQHDYASHIFTNCHKNNKQRTHIARGKNMHTKILFPLKMHRRPSAVVSRLLRSTATCLGLD